MRDCETCVNARPFGGENDNRCSAWECEYINRDEAIEAYKIIKAMREEEGGANGRIKVPNRSKDRCSNRDR